MDDLSDLLALAEDLARRAAELQLERLDSGFRVGTKSTATDMVTAVDREVETLLVDGIRAARPDDGILGEEGADVEGTSGYRWVVDPIDGTTNYLYGHPGFAVSIACERDGKAIVGVVQRSASPRCFRGCPRRWSHAQWRADPLLAGDRPVEGAGRNRVRLRPRPAPRAG